MFADIELWLGLMAVGSFIALVVVNISLKLMALASVQRWVIEIFEGLPSWLVNYCRKQRKLDLYAPPLEQWLLLRLLIIVGIVLAIILPISVSVKFGFLCVLALTWINRRRRQKRYMNRVIHEWPSALDITSMLLHSGLSLNAAFHALHDVAEESAALNELARINRQQQAGVMLQDALDELHLRISHPQIEIFCQAIKQAKITGSSLAETLQHQAQQARNNELLAAEKRAQEIGVKLLFPLLSCFFPVTFLLILGPVFIGFMQG